ncbi:hypothetical protein CMV_009223 [Castanea mollissima]|uniref:RNase H type-1 domain-containing protein n=1 Tax=Castanea mollissima TaxID=60419 RepID=A0A8J4R7G7_9ROSI|nr:hypothetical protein CMV_009223 [Castanea mollissima]
MDWIKANAHCNMLAQGKCYAWAHFFLFGIWHLWLRRNKLMFQPLNTPQNLFQTVEAQVYEFCICVLDQIKPRRSTTITVGWVKPLERWVKLNMDGAVKGNPGMAGCGELLRDCHGNWLWGFARAIGITSSLSAELWAIRDGLARCCHLSIEAVEVEVDASVATSLISKDTHTNGELSSLIDDCRNLMKNIQQVSIQPFVLRSQLYSSVKDRTQVGRELVVEALAVQLTQREGELIQEKAEVKKLANFLKQGI